MSAIQGDLDLKSCQKKCLQEGFIFAGIKVETFLILLKKFLILVKCLLNK